MARAVGLRIKAILPPHLVGQLVDHQHGVATRHLGNAGTDCATAATAAADASISSCMDCVQLCDLHLHGTQVSGAWSNLMPVAASRTAIT